MNDKEYMQTVLDTTKGLCDLMLHGAIESSTADVHEAFTRALNETLSIQNEVYSKMSSKGWYPSTQTEPQKISAVKEKFSGQA